jgi:hypothetical protein
LLRSGAALLALVLSVFCGLRAGADRPLGEAVDEPLAIARPLATTAANVSVRAFAATPPVGASPVADRADRPAIPDRVAVFAPGPRQGSALGPRAP